MVWGTGWCRGGGGGKAGKVGEGGKERGRGKGGKAVGDLLMPLRWPRLNVFMSVGYPDHRLQGFECSCGISDGKLRRRLVY